MAGMSYLEAAILILSQLSSTHPSSVCTQLGLSRPARKGSAHASATPGVDLRALGLLPWALRTGSPAVRLLKSVCSHCCSSTAISSRAKYLRSYGAPAPQ